MANKDICTVISVPGHSEARTISEWRDLMRLETTKGFAGIVACFGAIAIVGHGLLARHETSDLIAAGVFSSVFAYSGHLGVKALGNARSMARFLRDKQNTT